MSESNNRLSNQEEEKKGKITGTIAGAAGVALGAVAAGTEAQAKEVLLCSYFQPEVAVGSVVIDPETDNDQDPVPNNLLDTGTSQYVHKGYVIKPMDEGVSTDWCVFKKKANGQDVKVGQLDGMSGQFLGFITDSGVALSGGKFYRVKDTGATLVSEYVGDMPQGGKITHFGGYIFASYAEADNHVTLIAISEADVLNHTGNEPIPIASTREISANSSTKYSKGIDADHSTNELVISLKQGVMTIDLTQFLGEDEQLSPDFSLADVTLGELQPLPLETVGTAASNGYKYHLVKGAENVIMQTPQQAITGESTTINKNQLGAGAKIKSLNELSNGGIYILFEDVPDGPSQTPVVLHESGEITQDPGDMTPYIKYCFVVAPEDQYLFEPVADPCANVECPPPNNECAESSCNSQTGDCEEMAKPDDTPCVGPTNLCATYHICKEGACVGGPTEYTCGDNNECTEDSCKPATGCNNIPLTGDSCNDGNPDTIKDTCVGGVCVGEAIPVEQNPEVVEQAPDVAEQDVVEQAEEIIAEVVEASPEANPEQEQDVVEQEEIAADTGDTTGDAAADATEDTTEDQTGDNDNATTDATPEANPEATPELDTHDLLYVEGEDATADTAEDIQAEISVETQEIIAAEEDPQEKSPGCGCMTTGRSPNNIDGTLLLGAMLIGLAARFRNRISAVFARK